MRIERSLYKTWLWLAISFLPLLIALPVQAEVKQNQPTAIRKIPQLSEVKLPATNVSELFSQSSTTPNPPNLGGKQGGEVVRVTSVEVNPTDNGVEVILQTTQGKALQPVTFALGRSYIANIPNAVLVLPQGQFRGDNPASGITRVLVTQTTANKLSYI